MSRPKQTELLTNIEPKSAEQIKSMRKDTKRGLFLQQLFTPEGATAQNNPLDKLWSGIHEEFGYGIKAEMVGATVDPETNKTSGGVLTWFGVLPEGMTEPKWTEAKVKAPKEKKIKVPKEPKLKSPKVKALPLPKPVDGTVPEAENV
jgi:hypothetical protein